jgi:5-methylthioribose kinase
VICHDKVKQGFEGTSQMSQYRRFTAEDAMHFANEFSELFGERSKLTAVSFGDSHMNQIFRIKNQFATSLIVKQALPFARGLSDRWPLTVDRSRLEAQALLNFGKSAPGLVVEVRHYDAELAAILMEDLDQYTLLEKALTEGRQFQKLGAQMAEFVAKTSFANSDFSSNLAAKKARQIQFQNPETLQISEDLLFNDSFSNNERNHIDASLYPLAQHLWLDEQLQAKVASLAASFRSKTQTLVHGDLTSSSIFVTGESLKVIDAEFTGFGPVGLDAGLFTGSLLTHYCLAPALQQDSTKAKDQQNYLHNQIKIFWQDFEQQFLLLCRQQCRDPLFSNEFYQKQYVADILRDLTGYAGCELIRQVLGTFRSPALAGIADPAIRLQVSSHALSLGQRLILQHQQISSIDQLLSWLPTGSPQ